MGRRRLLGLLAVLVVLRYRAMIPPAYGLLLLEQAARHALATVHLGAPPLGGSPAGSSMPASSSCWRVGLDLSRVRDGRRRAEGR